MDPIFIIVLYLTVNMEFVESKKNHWQERHYEAVQRIEEMFRANKQGKKIII